MAVPRSLSALTVNNCFAVDKREKSGVFRQDSVFVGKTLFSERISFRWIIQEENRLSKIQNNTPVKLKGLRTARAWREGEIEFREKKV